MPGKKPAAKKGPGAGTLAALKARREKELEEERLRKQQEEEDARREEEERLRVEEEERKKAERAKQRAEEREVDKKGKQLSAAERRKTEEARKKLEQMQKMGIAIPEAALKKLKGEAEGGEPDKKKPAKTETLAQKKKRLEREKAEREAAAAKEQAAEKKEKAVREEEFDDWEQEAEEWEHEAEEAEKHDADAESAAQDEPAEQHVDPAAEAAVAEAEAAKNKYKGDLRSPICCVLGHVDTGKTKLLDYIRRTNVQNAEAGGITQQVGASFFPAENLIEKTRELSTHLKSNLTIDVPGLLVIDTPGHESFANLRKRGSALCDIAILVVDIMHGLEPQTRESLQLLKDGKTPFVVALNKIDRLYEWEVHKDSPFPLSYQKQKSYVKDEFERRMQAVQTELSELGLNSALYTKNKDFKKTISLVPTSAHTGEGIPDLLMLMVQLTQRYMNQRLTLTDELQCSLLEVKKVEGHGVTIDVILVNGTLNEGDTIVVCGKNAPIVTQIRALLTPQPMREIRVKAEYVHHKTIRAAQGIKIAATGLEEAVPGTTVLRLADGDDIETLQGEVMRELGTIVKRTQGDTGVAVQASTLGALEALLTFLDDDCKIPVSTVGVGELHKKDVMRLVGVKEKSPKYAVILCFNVEISKEARQVAEKEGIRIFTAEIIYHLQDMFKKYLVEYSQKLIEKNKEKVVFPCVVRTLPDKVFRAKDPIVLGMTVVEGQLRPGTPLFIWKTDEKGKKAPLLIGKVETCERDHKEQKKVEKGQEAAVKIKAEGITFGRQVTEADDMISLITRESIDALKESFKEEMTKADWGLVVKLKSKLGIL